MGASSPCLLPFMLTEFSDGYRSRLTTTRNSRSVRTMSTPSMSYEAENLQHFVGRFLDGCFAFMGSFIIPSFMWWRTWIFRDSWIHLSNTLLFIVLSSNCCQNMRQSPWMFWSILLERSIATLVAGVMTRDQLVRTIGQNNTLTTIRDSTYFSVHISYQSGTNGIFGFGTR